MAAVLQRRPTGTGDLERWLPVAFGLLAMVLPTWYDLARGLWREDEYSHGPLIIAVVGWLLWRQRADFALSGTTPAPASGGVLAALGLMLYVLGRSQGVPLLEVGSQLPLLAGVLLVMGGWRLLARFRFPLLFLAFQVPLPGFILDSITGPLKSYVSHLVEALLYATGYPIARSGVVLSIGPYQLLVADACSGLNSLYSLAALGTLFLHLSRTTGVLRNVLLLSGIVPIAIAANVMRVLALVLITYYFGDEAGQGFLHDFAGMMLFIVALGLLFGLDALLRRLTWLAPREARA